MSMKILARLMEQRGSFIETSYLRNSDLMVLENVPAEMVFEASQGFMEHESQRHDYLPYFHLIGQIKEIHGSFPFNVTTLYFSAKDESFLIKDLYYYPSPEELAHIIGTGRFYSRHFQIPPILSANTYTLPCRLNLSIVPPANQAQYEANQYTRFMELDDEDKTNLPVFYVGVTGSGVTRRTDRLLDYYGIDVPDMEDQFVFTAESSGYTDPPLMKYMEAPMVSQEVQYEGQEFVEDSKDDLLRTEAERQREDMQKIAEKQEQVEFRAATPEDALIAQTDREIERRMSERFDGQRMSLAAAREHDRRVQADEDQARPVREEVQPGRYDGPREADGSTGGVKAVSDKVSDTPKPDVPKPDAPKAEKAAPEVSDADRQRQEERERLRARVEQMRGRSKLQPQPQQAQSTDKTKEQKQQVKEIEMDFDPEHNASVEKDRGEAGEATADRSELGAMKGTDVSDARTQVKVDEAHAQDLARMSAARAAAVKSAEQKQGVGREVTEPLESVARADAEAKAKAESSDTADQEKEKDDEYL